MSGRGFAAVAAGVAGAALVASSLGVIPLSGVEGQLAYLAAAAVPASIAVITVRRLLAQKHDGLVAYEVRFEGSRRLVERLRSLPHVLRGLGAVHGYAAVMEVCGKRGCRVLVLVPRDENVELLLRGMLAGFRVRRLEVNSLDKLLEGGDSEPIPLLVEPWGGEEGGGDTRGEVLLGIEESSGRLVYASVEEFWRHTGIFGTTGSGKTTTTAFISAQLARYVRVLVFDWHGEYPAVLNRMSVEYVEVEPPRLPIIPDDMDIEVTVDVLEDAFDLTRHQSMLLYQALRSMSRRDALPEELEEFTDSLLATIEVQQAVPSRAELEIRAALERRIKSLVTGEGKRFFRVRGRVELPAEPGLYVLNVHRIMLLPLRRVYTRMLLAYLYYTAIAMGRMLDTIVVLEEAHNIASNDARTIPSILAEARKRHLGLIIVTQSPSSLHPSVLKNTNIRIVHTLKSAYDISVVARSMSLQPDQRVRLSKLPVGYAIVDTPQLEQPVTVYVPALNESILASRVRLSSSESQSRG